MSSRGKKFLVLGLLISFALVGMPALLFVLSLKYMGAVIGMIIVAQYYAGLGMLSTILYIIARVVAKFRYNVVLPSRAELKLIAREFAS